MVQLDFLTGTEVYTLNGISDGYNVRASKIVCLFVLISVCLGFFLLKKQMLA